jgi:ATP-binding cassette subfamily B protein
MARVRHCAKQGRLDEFVDNEPDGYDTIVGERGVRLSGGQKQRIGIARALYRQVSVLILDEATSALDNETESAVMSSIENLSKDLTIIIVAHRTSTLANCDRIIRLQDGTIRSEENYTGLQKRGSV